MTYQELMIHTDGGARGNPGRAAVGVVIEGVKKGGEHKLIAEFGKVIEDTTNNVAEYRGVLEALRYLVEQGIQVAKITFFLDSQLVARQLSEEFKIKKLHLLKLFSKIKTLESRGGYQVTYLVIPREKNAHADRLVNRALDQATY